MPTPRELERFEAFATEVDGILQHDNEPPATDELVKRLMDAGLDPVQAANRIVAERAVRADLEAKIPAEAPILDESLPQPPEQLQQPGPHAPGLVYLRCAPQDRKIADKAAQRVAKFAAMWVEMVDCDSGDVIKLFPPSAGRHSAKTVKPVEREIVPAMPTVIDLMRRPGGVSALEVKAALGWHSQPNSWFFKKWATQVGRAGDLQNLGKHLDGSDIWALVTT